MAINIYWLDINLLIMVGLRLNWLLSCHVEVIYFSTYFLIHLKKVFPFHFPIDSSIHYPATEDIQLELLWLTRSGTLNELL